MVTIVRVHILVIKDYAIDNFKNGLNCAECLLEALVRSDALKCSLDIVALGIGFGGGMGMCGYTCGALLAAVMANGAVYGRPDPMAVDPEMRSKEIAGKYYRRYNRLVHDFAKANNRVLCRDITAGQEWHSKERMKMCLKVVGNTAVLAYDYLIISQEEAFALPYGPNMGGLK